MENVFGIPIGDSVASAMKLTVDEVRADLSRRFEFRWHNRDIILPSPAAIHEYATTVGREIYGDDIEVVTRLNSFLEYEFLFDRDGVNPEPLVEGAPVTLISDPEEAVGIFLGVIPASRPLKLNVNKTGIWLAHHPEYLYAAPLSMVDLSLDWNSRADHDSGAANMTIAEVSNLIHPKVFSAPGVAWWGDTFYSIEELSDAVDRSKFAEDEALLWAVLATYDDTGSMPNGSLADNLAIAAGIAQHFSAVEVMSMYEYGFKNHNDVFGFFDAGLDPITHQSYLRQGMKDYKKIAEAYEYGIEAHIAARM